MNRKWKIGIAIALVLAVLAIGGVWAADAAREGAGRAWGKGLQHGVMGKITAIDGDKVTVKPELPAWLASKLSAKGITPPALPESVTFWVGDKTKAYRNSAQASVSDFKLGDSIAARLDGDPASGTAHAKRLADDATVQQLVGKLKERREERIARDGRPVMGTITAISGATVTIKPELPKVIGEKFGQRERPLPQLPESLSFTVGAETQLLKANAPAQLTDFAVGDEIGAMVKGDLKAGSGSAAKFMDLATARQLIQEKLAARRSQRNAAGAGAGTGFRGGRLSGWSGNGVNANFMLAGNNGDGPQPGGGGRGGERGGGGPDGPGEGQGGPREGHRPAFGKITAIDGSKITIKPELPPFAKEHAKEEGRELPPLPDNMSFSVNADTTYILNGKAAKLADFKVGDEIAALLNGRPREGNAVALKLADAKSAREAFGHGGPGGPGAGEGREHGPRPMFGTVTSVDSHTITIKPERPEFMKKFMEERRGQGGGPGGEGGPGGAGGPGGKGQGGGQRGEGGGPEGRELPAQVTVSLTSETLYFQADTQVKGNPFKAGDKVAIMPAEGSTPDNATARAVTDYSTAETRMKERMAKDGKGKGSGKGKAKNGQSA